MGKLTLKSVQDKRCLESIIKGDYKPDFNRSYGSSDSECIKSYKYMLDKLSDKTGREYEFGKDTCIWSWYKNPFFQNHINIDNIGIELVVITFEIDEKDVVFSDFDKWCDRIVDCWGIDSIVELSDIEEDECIQAVSWGIPKDGILKVEPFDMYISEIVW